MHLCFSWGKPGTQLKTSRLRKVCKVDPNSSLIRKGESSARQSLRSCIGTLIDTPSEYGADLSQEFEPLMRQASLETLSNLYRCLLLGASRHPQGLLLACQIKHEDETINPTKFLGK